MNQLFDPSPDSQQTFEALAIGVAFRRWGKELKQSRATLRVRSDSVTALSMASKLGGPGYGRNVIARGLAWEYSFLNYAPTG